VRWQTRRLTDYITITIFVLDMAERLEGRLLQDGGIFVGVSGSYGEANSNVGHVGNDVEEWKSSSRDGQRWEC
jgi:hypothetical protein